MQQCWKGSVGAVDEVSSREDSNTSNHILRDLLSTEPSTLTEGVNMQPLCKLSCSKWILLHMALIPALCLQQQLCVFTWQLMATLSWSVLLGH